MLYQQGPFGNREAGLVLWKEMKLLPRKHISFITETYFNYCLATNQLYKNNIHGKEYISHFLLDNSTKLCEKYLGTNITFFRNVLMGHLKNLKRKK
jgi:hypothetical protein